MVGIARDAESFTPPGLGNKRAIGAGKRAVEVLTISPRLFSVQFEADRQSQINHVRFPKNNRAHKSTIAEDQALGAVGFLLKTTAAHELVDVITAALNHR